MGRYVALEPVLETLAKIYDHGSSLTSATITRFDGDLRFVTGVELRFGSLPATFRASKDDDTLIATIGPLVATSDETLVDVSSSAPWAACVGLGARWLWELTNQQGYTDGVRFEFGEPDKPLEVVVELIVLACEIEIFVSQVRDAT